MVARRRPQSGDVFQIPFGDDRVAYGQVLSEDVFVHTVVFEGLYDEAREHDLDEASARRSRLYAWTRSDLFGKPWNVVANRRIDRDHLPPVEFVEMAVSEEFQRRLRRQAGNFPNCAALRPG